MSQTKILIIGGLHGNEPLGISISSYLQNLNITNLDAIYGNPLAIIRNERFCEADLNRLFPGKKDGKYEENRAFEILEICKNYDLVLDFHNTFCPDNDCCFVGDNFDTDLLKVAQFLGLKKVIIADYDCLNKFAPNCISIEISLQSKLNNVALWINKLQKLSESDLVKAQKPKKSKLDFYKFAYRVSRTQQNQFNFRDWRAFEPIPKNDILELNLDLKFDYFPIFVDDKYTKSYNFAGLIVNNSD